MMRPNPCTSSRSRQEGRAEIVVAALLAILMCAAISVTLFLFLGERTVVAPLPQVQPVAQGTPATGDSTAPGPIPEAPSVREEATPAASVATEAEVLEPKPRLSGTVRGSGGGRVPDALVRWIPAGLEEVRPHRHDGSILGPAGDSTRLPAGSLRDAVARSVSTRTDAEGGFSLELPSSGAEGTAVAWAEGHTLALREVSLPTASGEGTAGGASRGDSGVEAPEGPAPPEGKETTVTKPTDTPAAGPPGVVIDFELEGAGSISGRVVDRATREPAAGMNVVAGILDREAPAMMSFVRPGGPTAIVGAEGDYRLVGLTAGEYRVVARTGRSRYASIPSRRGKTAVVEAGRIVSDVDFEVDGGGVVRGRVLDGEGAAVRRAHCGVVPVDAMAASARGDVETITLVQQTEDTSGDDGSFALEGLPLGTSYQVLVRHPEYAGAIEGPVEISAEKPEAEVELTLTPGSAISGKVVDARGAAAAGIKVTVIPDLGKLMSGDFSGMSQAVATSDASGRFRLEHLGAGEHRLHPGPVSPQEALFKQDGLVTVTVDGRSDVTDVVLTLAEKKTGEIAGRVVNDAGQPVAAARVEIAASGDFMALSPTRVETDAEGRFVARELGEPLYRVEASRAGHSSHQLPEVAVGSHDVALVLTRHGVIHGEIVTSDGGPPPAGGKVRPRLDQGLGAIAALMRSARGEDDGSAEIRADGSFSLEAPAGEVVLEAIVPGHAPATARPVMLSPGAEYRGLVIRVSTGATIRGRVVLGGAGVPGATVNASPDDEAYSLLARMMPQIFGSIANSAVTGDDGSYQILHLAEGGYSLTVSHPRYAPGEPVTLFLRADSVVEAPILELSPGATLRGRVHEDGKGLQGLMAQAIGPTPVKQGFTDAEGRFELEGLKAGEYLVNVTDIASLQKGRMRIKSSVVTIEPGATHEVEIVFGVGSRVHGKIEGLPPTPMRMVTLRRPGGPAPEDLDPLDFQSSVEAGRYQAGVARVGPDGAYTIEDIEPGEYILEIPRMPADPTDLVAYRDMDRTPHYRKEIEVGDDDLELDIRVP